jgi:hypothetical protein
MTRALGLCQMGGEVGEPTEQPVAAWTSEIQRRPRARRAYLA